MGNVVSIQGNILLWTVYNVIFCFPLMFQMRHRQDSCLKELLPDFISREYPEELLGILLTNIRYSLFCTRLWLPVKRFWKRKSEFLGSEMEEQWVIDLSHPLWPLTPPLLRLGDMITRFCKNIYEKTAAGDAAQFLKMSSVASPWKTLRGRWRDMCVCVYICERGCFRVLFGLWFCYERN